MGLTCSGGGLEEAVDRQRRNLEDKEDFNRWRTDTKRGTCTSKSVVGPLKKSNILGKDANNALAY